MFSIFRIFHCPHCKRCTLRFEKHSYLVNRCIGANNAPYYYLHIILENVNTFIVFWSLMITFEERIDADLVFFIIYLFCGFAHQLHYLKKFIVITISMITNETIFEREKAMNIHWKNERQISMMERM